MSHKRQKVRKALIFISFLLFPITMNHLSPYIILVGTAAGILTGSLLFFSTLFLGSLFFGRAFCGYVCPVAGHQEICSTIQNKAVKKGSWIKYLIWVPWLGSILFLAIQAGGYHLFNPFLYTDYGISISNPYSYINYYLVIILITVLALSAGRRSFCQHLCWMAPFMVIGTRVKYWLRWPSLHLEADPPSCSSCQRCTKECPMSLEVHQMVQNGKMDHDECILCGNCVDVCPKKSIRYAWRFGKCYVVTPSQKDNLVD